MSGVSSEIIQAWALRRIDTPDGYFYPAFLECVDEDWASEHIEALAQMFGFEMINICNEYDWKEHEPDWFRSALQAAQAAEPDPDGWLLVGAHDSDNGEIVRVYVRRIEAAPTDDKIDSRGQGG